jgi:hypothetical protein
MDPALRPRPVSSVAFAYLGNAYNSTARLNDGIFTVHRFSVATFARLHQSECVFRFYVYGGIFDNPPGLLSARGTCWLFGGIVRYRLSSQQKVHRCNSVLEKGKSMRGDNSFYFLQLSTIYGIIPHLIYSTSILNHSCPVVPY